MNITDVIISLSPDNRIRKILWNNGNLQKLFGVIWDRHRTEHVKQLFPELELQEETGTFQWEETPFDYQIVSPGGNNGESLLLLRLFSDRDYLLTSALDRVDEGVQIYDRNAHAVFFNMRSRQISDISDSIDIEGRHLLDMYPLDENVSTTLTALRTGQPVINRVDHFNSSDGSYIATANTAYPIWKNGELLGTVVFEQDKDVVDGYIKRMNEIETALNSYDDPESYLHFTGYTFQNILGEGSAMLEAISIARRISSQECNVLLIGETGTGKELFAQAIHQDSMRKKGKFLAINCAAVPENLIEGLLFGTARGGFTGSEDRPGYLEEASGGTLFLDELNSMSLSMQSKILRAVQEQTIRRVGGQDDIRIDVRFISSCNEDPFVAIRENRLRKDLFYRLSTVMIPLPSLREHPEDIETLCYARIKNANPHFVNKINHISDDVIRFFHGYSWPGNVRELFHVIDYALNISDSDTIEMSHLPKYLLEAYSSSDTEDPARISDNPDWRSATLQSLMDTYEEKILRQALDHFEGNISQTASALEIRRQSLQYRIRKYGIIL